MKKEHKDLLIADLCGRLPYKALVEFVSYEGEEKPWIGELSCKDLDCFIHDVGFVEIKPYLFPLSSMNEEQKEEYCSLQQRVVYNSKGLINSDVMEYVNWCYKKHIDINNLIPMGLAKDATGLNLYDMNKVCYKRNSL